MSSRAKPLDVPPRPRPFVEKAPDASLADGLGVLGDAIAAVARDSAAAAAAQVLDQVREILADAAAVALRPPIGPAPSEEMTTADVCELFKIDPKTLWTWRRDPDHPFPAPYRCGDNTIRYLRADVNAWRAARIRVELRRSSPTKG